MLLAVSGLVTASRIKMAPQELLMAKIHSEIFGSRSATQQIIAKSRMKAHLDLFGREDKRLPQHL